MTPVSIPSDQAYLCINCNCVVSSGAPATSVCPTCGSTSILPIAVWIGSVDYPEYQKNYHRIAA